MEASHEHSHDHGHSHEQTPPPPSSGATSGVLMNLTEAAIAKVKAFADTNKDAAGKYLRVYVQGGG